MAEKYGTRPSYLHMGEDEAKADPYAAYCIDDYVYSYGTQADAWINERDDEGELKYDYRDVLWIPMTFMEKVRRWKVHLGKFQRGMGLLAPSEQRGAAQRGEATWQPNDDMNDLERHRRQRGQYR